MTVRWTIVTLMIGFALSLSHFPTSTAFGKYIDPSDYQFPYKNPYIASITALLLKSSPSHYDRYFRYKGWSKEAESKIKILKKSIEIFPDRDHFYKYLLATSREGRGKLDYLFYQQPYEAPMIVLFAGLGGYKTNPYFKLMADLLTEAGFHVLMMPSVFHWHFAISGSRHGFPGIPAIDSQDLYFATKKVIQEVKEKFQAKITKIGLVGFSMGGLHASYIAKLEQQEQKNKKIGFSTYLMVNPIADLWWGAKRVDQVLREGSENWPKEYRNAIKKYFYRFLYLRFTQNSIDDPEYFADLDKIKLGNNELFFLFAKYLQESIGNLIYVQEIMREERGELGSLEKPLSRWNSHALLEAQKFSITKYFQDIVLPNLDLQVAFPGSEEDYLSPEKLKLELSIWKNKELLSHNKNIFLMHNADDPLISVEDLQQLNSMMGDRARIYPYGGHMGNLWYPQFKQDLLEILHPLKY